MDRGIERKKIEGGKERKIELGRAPSTKPHLIRLSECDTRDTLTPLLHHTHKHTHTPSQVSMESDAAKTNLTFTHAHAHSQQQVWRKKKTHMCSFIHTHKP